MNDERLPRHWSTTKAYDALQRLIEGKHRLHIPVQESDEDRIIAAVIDERDALTAALDAATARAAVWEQRANTAADLVAGMNEAALRDAARLAALTAWDDEQHRFYHDATLVPGSPEWERQYAKQAVLWRRLLKLLEAQRSAASPAAAKPQD